MKKIYITPCLKKTISMEEELLDVNSLPIFDKEPSTGNNNINDHGDLLAKPGIIYDAWEDDDKEIDFHTDV